MSTKTDALTTIAFSTPIIAHAPNVKKIHIDATYKTAKGRFELYAIVGQFGFFRGILRIAGSCGQEVVVQKYILAKPT